MMSHPQRRPHFGLTLFEMLVVLVILAAVAGVVVPLLGHARESGQDRATRASLTALRDAIVGAPGKASYWQHTGRLPRTLADLYFLPNDELAYLPATLHVYDPRTGRGWNGPYLTNSGVTAAGPLDGYGQPILLQWPIVGTDAEKEYYLRLVSPGPNGLLETPDDELMPAASARGDDLVLFLRAADMP